MTAIDNTLFGPEEPGSDWAAIEDAVLAATGVEPTPVSAAREVEPVVEDEPEVEVDPEADLDLWPQVLDAKGRPTGEIARPNPAAARAALAKAETLSESDVDLLAEAISEHEAREIIDQAFQLRAAERQADAEVTELRMGLAVDGARRQAQHEAKLAESRRRRENRAAAARERRDRVLDPSMRMVRLAAAERTVPLIAVLPAVLAAVLGAVNVGVCLDRLSPSTHVINWLVEPLLTLPVIAILLAQIAGAIAEGKDNPFWALEWTLVAVAVGLNVGLHIAVDGRFTAAAAVWAIVPGGLAISAHLVPKLIREVRAALAKASDEPQTFTVETFVEGPGPGPVQVDRDWTGHGPSQVSDESDPKPRSEDERRVAFLTAVQNGRIDPKTGRAMDPMNIESIRRTLQIGKDRARALHAWFAARADAR